MAKRKVYANSEVFGRIATRITKTAFDRLAHACVELEMREGARTTHGRVINDLVMRYLDPAPDEPPAAAPTEQKRPVPVRAVAG